MATQQQMDLFEETRARRGSTGEYGAPVASTPALTATSSLASGMTGFHDYMIRQGFAENTVKAFMGDLKILRKFLGSNRSLNSIGTKELNDFLTWMRHERGVPCSPKTYARRITTLKVFFGWLEDSEVLPSDPAAAIVHQPVRTPLPVILYDDEVEQLIRTAQDLLWRRKNPDARPYVLTNLVLQTAIKKGECVSLQLTDVDISNPQQPAIYVRYSNPRLMHKERKLGFSPTLVPALRQYLNEYKPQERLFECTARNLEYVLSDVAELAEITDKPVSFEALRWTSAVRDFRNGMPEEHLRQKLGLSPISWRETSEKIKKLASPGL